MRSTLPCQRPEAAFCRVPGYGVADLAARSKTNQPDPWGSLLRPGHSLHDKCRCHIFPPLGERKEVLPFTQANKGYMRGAEPHRMILRGKALAPLGTTGSKHGAAAHGCHARTETMAALADNSTRLVGAFHGKKNS
jgi:hypothetical protein